jgi:hypothetical protein
MSVQVPEEGNPVNITLPVDTVHEGGVMVPTVGAAGVDGCTFITTFPEGLDIQPAELVTVKVKVPDGIADIVVVVPVPVTVTLPGVLVSVHVPVEGNPLNATLPVDIAHVGWVMVPTTGAERDAGWGVITTSADTPEVHPA